MPSRSNALKIVILGDAKNAQQAFDQASAAAAQTSTAMAASFAAAGAAFALIEGSVIKTSAEFERFRTQLDTIEGSSQKAAASMDWITQFTKNTPFELQQVTDAFVQMKAFGIDPIANDSLKTLGNTSAAMGRTLDQSVQALADAVTGEFERLKEFGIKARTVGDQVQFSYQQNGEQMVATADKTSQAMIQATLLGIFNDKYTGGMEKLSHTWDGMMSNLSDSWTIFQKQIGDAGAFDAAKNSLALVLDELQKNDGEVQALATNISDGLVTAMETGVTGIALTAKGFAAMGVAADGVRSAVDLVSLAMVSTFDTALSGLQSFYDALAHLPGSIGQPYAQASKDISTFRNELSHLETGIKQAGGESTAALISGLDGLGAQFDAIDKKAVKFVTAMEKARGASANPSASSDSSSVGAPHRGRPPSGPSPEVLKAQADAAKIIDIHSAKFKQIQILGRAAFSDEQDLLLAKQDADIAALDAEQQRMHDAAAAQGANKQQLDNMDAYYDQLKIDRAQQTEDQLAAIDDQATQDKLSRIASGEQAAYDLKGQFQQLVTANQQVNLDAMAGNLAAFAKTSAMWDKFTADQKLSFAAASLNALSGLMSSHNRKAFEAGKLAAQGENAINTYLGATKAYQSLSGIPVVGPFLGAAAAAAVVAAGVANAQKINSAKMGGSTGGVAIPTVSAGGGGAMPTASTAPSTGLPAAQQPQQQPISMHITFQSTLGDVSPEVQQQAVDSLMPMISDALGRGQHLAVGAV